MILNAFRLDGRVALVTGAARGLGQAIAVGLAEAGADIALLDRLPLAETMCWIEALDRRCSALEWDLAGLTGPEASGIVDRVADAFGRVDILVNNAGVIRRAPALDFSQADRDASLALNLSAPFFLSQAFARRVFDAGRGGKIINLASMLSFQGGSSVPAYTATKSGVAGLTRALANEWVARGINVNAIAPGVSRFIVGIWIVQHFRSHIGERLATMRKLRKPVCPAVEVPSAE